MSSHDSDPERDKGQRKDAPRDKSKDDDGRSGDSRRTPTRKGQDDDADDERQRGSRKDEHGEKAEARDERDERDTPNPIQVQKFLGGIDYPADKKTVLSKAREAGADELVMDALARLPDGDFDSPVSISRELGKLG